MKFITEWQLQLLFETGWPGMLVLEGKLNCGIPAFERTKKESVIKTKYEIIDYKPMKE